MKARKSSENRTLRVKSKKRRQLKKLKRRMIVGKFTEAEESNAAYGVLFHSKNEDVSSHL